MNLFENLQIMNESENKLVSEFREFLNSKNAQYIANEIGETKDGMQIVIYDGDWKHEHLYMKHLLDEFFTNKGMDISITSEEIGESDQDTFSARYDIKFNAKPKEYTADVKPLKFTTEVKLPKPPKFWDSMFKVNVIKAYKSGDLTLDNIEEWETKYNSGIKPNPSLGTKEILDYYIKNIDKLEESNMYHYKYIQDTFDNKGIITELRLGFGPHGEERFEVYQNGTLNFWCTDEKLAKEKFKEISKRVPKEYKLVNGKYKAFYGDGELASIWESIDTSNWKQRFKGMDVYVSDKYPNYQIKKSYTSSKQEVWQVLDFKTQREVFVSSTFEGAIEFVENKKIVKELNNDIDALIDKVGGISKVKEILVDIKNAYPNIENNIDELIDMSYSRVEDNLSFREWSNVVEYINESTLLKESNFEEARFITDDLNKFENDVIENLSNASHGDIVADVIDCYYDEDTNTLEMTAEYNDVKHTHTEKIFNVSTVNELIKSYSHKFVNDFLWCFIADTEHEEMIKESVDLSEYEYVGPATGYNKGWSLYHKIVDGKGVWVAEHQQTKEVVPINYDQVQGFEPIKLQGIQKLQKDLGDMLLPKRESNDEDYDDNAATFLDTLEKEVKEAAHKFMLSVGFPEDEADDYLSVSTDINDDYVMVAVGAELGYDSLFNLCQTLDKVIAKHDEDAYFEPECPGRIVAYLFGEKVKKVHKEKEQALKDKINSLDKIEETNHNIVEDRDYATGEEMYNEFVKYLNSLDQIAMDGKDCNWEPSEFNAKNLNADGEIYLECGAYILIYPYINEWAEDYFKVIIIDAETCELSTQIKNGIENIFNKFKTDKWQLIFEG